MKRKEIIELVTEYQHYETRIEENAKAIQLFEEAKKVVQKKLMAHGMHIKLPKHNTIVRNGIPYPYTPETPQDEMTEL